MATNPPSPAPRNPDMPKKASSLALKATKPSPEKTPEVRTKASRITNSSEAAIKGTKENAIHTLKPSQYKCLTVVFSGTAGVVYILYMQKKLTGRVSSIGAKFEEYLKTERLLSIAAVVAVVKPIPPAK